MRLSHKIQTSLYVFFLILFSVFPIALALVNMILYGGVLNTKLQFLSIMMIIPVVVIRKMNTYSIRSASILLIVAFFIVVNQYIGLPEYTYSEGRGLLKEALGDEEVFMIVDTRRDSYKGNETVNRYIDELFYYEVSVKNSVIKYVMNPITGEYEILEES